MVNKSIAKLSIFTALLMCAPSFYFIGVAAGFIPAIFYLYYIIGDSASMVLWGIHLVVYIALYYFIAHVITAIIFRIKNNRVRTIIFTILIATLLISSFFPIYMIGGHSSTQSVNIIGMYKKAGDLSYVPW